MRPSCQPSLCGRHRVRDGRLLRAAGVRWPDAVLLGVDISMGMSVNRPPSGPGRAPPGRRPLPDTSRWVEALPLATGRVDLVTATLTYRHWSDQAAGLAQIRRILTTDGVLGMATICAPRAAGRNRLWRRSNFAALTTALAPAGLRIRKITTLTVAGPIPQITLLIAQPTRSRT